VSKLISKVSVSEVNAMFRDMKRVKYDRKLQITQTVSSLKSDKYYSLVKPTRCTIFEFIEYHSTSLSFLRACCYIHFSLPTQALIN